MIVRNNSQARHAAAPPVHRFPAWTLGIAGGVAAAGVLTYLMIPSIHLTSGGAGIAELSASGFHSRLVSASFDTRGHVDFLRLNGTALIPGTKINPGTSGTVVARVQGPGFLRFLPWDTQTVAMAASSPQPPAVPGNAVRPLGGGLTLRLTRSVTAVRFKVPGGSVHTVSWTSARMVVNLPLPTAAPGSTGAVAVWMRARPWERYGPKSTVTWTTVPYVTAAALQTNVSPTGRLVVNFSQAIRTPHLSDWTVSPSVAGTWRQVNATQFAFTPSGSDGYGPNALVAVTIPGGSRGPEASSGSVLQSSTTIQWTTPAGSVLRLQQLLASEGYLPAIWTATNPVPHPTVSYEDGTIYNPPTGQFTWAYPNLPSQLQALWSPGQMTVVTKGAIMQFEAANGLPVDGIAGPEVWKTLIADRVQGRVNPNPYTYIAVTQNLPETLQLWVGNHLALTTKTNTGIPATPTYLGTFPIYERLAFQIMRGKNPNGVKYADPVYWINYFKGSDAVHGFVRASYGFPQSLGCVEVPPAVAQTIFKTVHYGTLVTVNPVGVAPAPAHSAS